MDLLLTLFLPACSLNEVPGRNDAVQNMFTFSQDFKTRLQGAPSALELAALIQVGSRSAVLLKFERSFDDEMKKKKRRLRIAEQIPADNGTDIFWVVNNLSSYFGFCRIEYIFYKPMCSIMTGTTLEEKTRIFLL
ncbi:hypothetical protein BASA83_003977 [Batrachochytrium salamandrivorans]|nr:hypothetical protein BASA83_003977 [Batrachochytrium salamandrivorans]